MNPDSIQVTKVYLINLVFFPEALVYVDKAE